MFNFRFEEYVNEGEGHGKELEFNPTLTRGEYNLMAPVWRKCRDAKSGGVAIKAAREQYLPKLKSDQTDKSYDDYVERAYWYGATGRTVEAFVGMIFRKSSTLTVENGDEDVVKELLSETTSGGNDSESLMREITEEVMVVNRVGVLEDYPQMEESVEMTQLEVERLGVHSYTTVYRTEDILNWKVEEIDGRTIPTMFVLAEREESEGENPLNPKVSRIIRVLYLQPEFEFDGVTPLKLSDLVYKQAVIEEVKTKGSKEAKYYVRKVIVPMKSGAVMNKIPFFVLSSRGEDESKIYVPPIYDLVEVNIGHYRNSADYEREMHWISIKTAVFPGWDKEKYGDLEVGGALASPPDQTPFILESGSSSPLKDELTKKEERMATLGAQLLAQKGRYVQAEGTARIQSRGESSIVADIARAVSDVMGKVFTLKSRWSGISEDVIVSVHLNTDFNEDRMDASNMKGFMELLQAGKISFDVYFYNLKKMEVYPDGWTQEQEIDAIIETQEILNSMTDEKFETLQQQILEMQGGTG